MGRPDPGIVAVVALRRRSRVFDYMGEDKHMSITDPDNPGKHYDTVTGNWEDDVKEAVGDLVQAAPGVLAEGLGNPGAIVADVEDSPEVKAALAALEVAKTAAEERLKAEALKLAGEAPGVVDDVKTWAKSHFDDIERWATEVEGRISALEGPKAPKVSSGGAAVLPPTPPPVSSAS